MLFFVCVFFCKQKTAYELRISDWSSDVCSSDLSAGIHTREGFDPGAALVAHLEHYGVKARLHILEGRDAGRTVLDFAVRSDADLIVMGAYGHSKFNETIFGGATRFLLRHSELPILLSL